MANEMQETLGLASALRYGDERAVNELLKEVLIEPRAKTIIQNANNKAGMDSKDTLQVGDDGSVALIDMSKGESHVVGQIGQAPAAPEVFKPVTPAAPVTERPMDNSVSPYELDGKSGGEQRGSISSDPASYKQINKYGQPLDREGRVELYQDKSGNIVDGNGSLVDEHGNPLRNNRAISKETDPSYADDPSNTAIYQDASGNLVDRSGRPVDSYGRLITPGSETPQTYTDDEADDQNQDREPPTYDPRYQRPQEFEPPQEYVQRPDPAAAFLGIFGAIAGAAISGQDRDRGWNRGNERPWRSYESDNGYGRRPLNGWGAPRSYEDYGGDYRYRRHDNNPMSGIMRMFGGF